jgi:hypothetical protein
MSEKRSVYSATQLGLINNKKVFFEKTVSRFRKEHFFAFFSENRRNILWNRDNRLTKYFSALRYNRVNHFQEVI